MLVHRHRGRAMQLARELGLLSVILPELIHAGHSDAIDHAFVEWDRTRRMLNELVDPRFELAAAILLHAVPGTAAVDRAAVIRTICRRLRLSNHETDDICGLVTRQDELVEAASLPLARLKRLLVDPLIREVLVLHRLKADAYGFDPAHVAFCENYLDMTPAEEIDPPPLISGDDLIGMGLQPGRRIGEILEAVRDAQLNGDIRTKNEAVQHVERLR